MSIFVEDLNNINAIKGDIKTSLIAKDINMTGVVFNEYPEKIGYLSAVITTNDELLRINSERFIANSPLFNHESDLNYDKIKYEFKPAIAYLPTLTKTPQSLKYTNFYSLIDVPAYNVTLSDDMFLSCYNIKTIPASYFSKAPVNLSCTFYGCNNLTNIHMINGANLTNLYATFKDCHKLKEVSFGKPPVNVFEDNSAMQGWNGLFWNCYELETVNNLSFNGSFQNANLFTGCSKLTNLKVYSENKLNTSGVLDLSDCPLLSAESVRSIFASLGACSDSKYWYLEFNKNVNLPTDLLVEAKNKGWTVKSI